MNTECCLFVRYAMRRGAIVRKESKDGCQVTGRRLGASIQVSFNNCTVRTMIEYNCRRKWLRALVRIIFGDQRWNLMLMNTSTPLKLVSLLGKIQSVSKPPFWAIRTQIHISSVYFIGPLQMTKSEIERFGSFQSITLLCGRFSWEQKMKLQNFLLNYSTENYWDGLIGQ